MTEGRKIYLNLQRNHVDIIGVYRYKLMIANSYLYESPEHLLYQTLNVAKQIGFDFETDSCVLLGDISSDDKNLPHFCQIHTTLRVWQSPEYCQILY